MIINVLFTVLVIFAGFIILRALFELIRFCFKMISLSRKLKKLEDRGIEV